MTKSPHASLTAIGHQLQADYFPTSAESLPAELVCLVAQLVAIESNKQEFEHDPSRYCDPK
jgi:hypothetical protein